MAELLLSPVLHGILFLCATGFTVVAVRRQKMLWVIAAALCAIGTCLLGLAADRSLEQLLTAILIPAAIVLYAQQGKEGGGDT